MNSIFVSFFGTVDKNRVLQILNRKHRVLDYFDEIKKSNDNESDRGPLSHFIFIDHYDALKINIFLEKIHSFSKTGQFRKQHMKKFIVLDGKTPQDISNLKRYALALGVVSSEITYLRCGEILSRRNVVNFEAEYKKNRGLKKIKVSIIDEVVQEVSDLSILKDLHIGPRDGFLTKFSSYYEEKDGKFHKIKNIMENDETVLNNFSFKSLSEIINFLRSQNSCALEPIYRLSPASYFKGRCVRDFRYNLGQMLVEQMPSETLESIDVVVPVPDTGLVYAQGFAEKCNKEIALAIHRNVNVKRSFDIENSDQRKNFIRAKLKVISDKIVGKNIALVDEAIFTGVTLRIVCEMLYECGVRQITIVIPTPPNVRKCGYNMMPKRNVLLDYVRREQLGSYFNVKDVIYASDSKRINKILGNVQICTQCFLGEVS